LGFLPRVQAKTVIAHYTVEDGLPSSEVYYIYQDIDGYIWFCTDRGISRFDGYNFTNYTLRDGLSCATNFRIYEDRQSNLWFTGFDGSLTIWDYQKKKFRAFEHNTQLQNDLGVYNWVHTIFFKDSTMEFHDFAGNKTFVYDTQEGAINFQRIDEVQSRELPQSILQDYDRTRLVRVSRYSRPYVIPIDYSKDSMAGWNMAELSRVMKQYHTTDDLSDIRQLDGRLYFSSGRGLEVYEQGVKVNTMFEDYGVSCVMVDHENYLWVSTTSNGVFVTTRNAVENLELGVPFERGEKITVLDLFQDEPVYGTNTGRLIGSLSGNILSAATDRFDIYSIKKRNEDLYISGGLKITSTGVEKVISSGIIDYITLPVNDTLILETGSNKYQFSSLNGGTISHHVNFRVLDAANLDSATVLISNMHNIYKITLHHIEPAPWLNNPKLKIEQVRKIKVGEQLVLLSTAGTGLYVCDKQGRIKANIDRSKGLASDMVNSCVLDESRSRMWCATNLGVSMIDYVLVADSFQVVNITNLNRSHGLSSTYCIDLALGKDMLWVASNTGITGIALKYSHTDVCSPNVVLEEFLCNGEVLVGNNHNLTYKQNDIQLAFSGFSLQRPVNAYFYRYRLVSDASDSTWSSTNQRRISYVNLSPGEYTFEVQSRIQNGDWAASKLVNFTIEPFILNRWSVRWVLIAIIVAAVGLLIRRRYTQIIAENKRELEFSTMQMKVNQSELDSLRGQMNPHFIFNALKSIQKFILTGDKTQANRLLTRFAKLIRSSLEFSRKDFIPLDQEIDFLTNYLEIEIQRTPNRFSYEINVETSNLDDVSIPSLMLQPICENAIKHAFVEAKGKLYIAIRKLEKGLLEVIIEDNGVGYFNRKSTRPKHQNSLGLEIIKSRLTLLGEQGFKGRLEIEPVDAKTKKGTRVKLQLPYQ